MRHRLQAQFPARLRLQMRAHHRVQPSVLALCLALGLDRGRQRLIVVTLSDGKVKSFPVAAGVSKQLSRETLNTSAF